MTHAEAYLVLLIQILVVVIPNYIVYKQLNRKK